MKKSFGEKLFLGLVIFSMLFVTANAADGDLDATFGTGGKVTVDFNGNPTDGQPDQDSGLDVAIQPDGKIIVVGESSITTTDSVMSATRLNPNGTLDTTFANAGKFMHNVATGIGERAYSVAIQPDGKILIAGRTNSPRQRVVMRLNANGSFDTAFGTNGIFQTPIGSPTFDEPEIVLQPDGKIIVIGATRNGVTTDAFSVMRLSADGSFDRLFGNEGEVVTVFQATDRAYGVVLQADGKILVSGSANNNGAFALARYNTDGSLDTSFGTNGKVTTEFTGMTSLAYNLTLQPDGKILAAGYARGQHTDAKIVRYNPDGSIDTSFGTNGITGYGITNNELFWDIFYTNGKILASGYSALAAGTGSPDNFMVVRFSDNGAIDTQFGNSGVVQTDFNTTRDLSLSSAMQPDGKLVLAGWTSPSLTFSPDFAVARYNINSVTPRTAMDFDGDGKSDISVYRPVNGSSSQWWIQKSSTNSAQAFEWGVQTDIPVAADFDGDQKTDIAVWRSGAQAKFLILKSSNNTFREEAFGQTGDKPLIGDFDGDGKSDPAVFREDSQSYFFYRASLNNPNGNISYIPWGTTGDKAVAGDFNGDGKTDFTVFRNGEWWILPNGSPNYETRQWGIATDKLVTADYDGDGKTDVAVYRPENGVWYIQNSSNGSVSYKTWGISTDTPVPADYDGDGKADVAVYRNGIWYILQSSSGNMRFENFGNAADTPIPSITVQ